jgi:hypothetical protein
MGLEIIEFKNYERELKYLLTGVSKLSLDQVLHFLNFHGYKVVETMAKEKHETYYDDAKFTLTKRGDVMRGSKHITEQFSGFMYKKNESDPNKPYVSKLELGSGQYKTVDEFIAKLEMDIEVLADPILYAVMLRDIAIVEKNLDRLYITYDKVDYFMAIGAEKVYEEMIEIEDWNRPNSTDVDYNYDAHLCEVNRVFLNGELPIKLTKDTKPYRGYKILIEKHETN